MKEAIDRNQEAKLIKDLRKKKSSFWMEKREHYILDLFRKVAKNVPAYKDYLKKNKIQQADIKSLTEFQKVPFMSKKEYLTQYPLNELLWDGHLNKPLIYTSTSGSTGKPFYFMRDELLDWQYSVIIEDYIKIGLRNNKGPTLVLVCFGMGVWIAGIITYKGFEMAAQRDNLPISILTPGINKKEIFNALKNLAPYYSQTIIVGYPPFVRDIIDEAPLNDINLKKLNIRLMFAAESITEKFRDYVGKKAGVENVYLDTLSIYGSADIGAMAFEGPTGILVRRLAEKKKKVFQELFSSINKHPTLAQFIPPFINFESPNGEIALTGNSALPLVRYKIGDNGGVLSFDNVTTILMKHDIDIYKEAEKLGIDKYISEIPFVYVYERTDLSTSFYGLWIYPEWFRAALLQPQIKDLVTGKFTLATKTDEQQNQYLEINLEMQKGKVVSKKFEKQIQDKITASLKANSSEYRELVTHLNGKAKPVLKFWPAEHPLYFQPGSKQKWVTK